MQLSELVTSMDLRADNPFAYGEILTLSETEALLESRNPIYQKSPRDRYYTLKDNDTLNDIADEAYGNSKLWWVIYFANLDIIFDPFLLESGQTILIPDWETFYTLNSDIV